MEADKRGFTISAYVSECLRRAVDWITLSEQFEYVHISRPILAAILEKSDEKNLVEIARKLWATRLKDLAIVLHGKSDLEGFRHVLELNAKYLYPSPVTLKWVDDAKESTVFIRHAICQKYSIMLGEACTAYLQAIGRECSYETGINSLKLTILKTTALK